MLISETVEVGLQASNIRYYESLNYVIPRSLNKKQKGKRLFVKRGTFIRVKVCDLPNNSNVLVEVKCDSCGEILNVKWADYTKFIHEDGRYYCRICACKIYGKQKELKTKLKNSKSFEQWCVEHDRNDILDRWDYELNNWIPNEVCYSTGKKYWFKCSKNLHGSELKSIENFINNQEGSMKCKQCNSFAQWGIDNLSEDSLEEYWDYEKNTVDPWKISYGSNKKVWIKCQNKNKPYHEDYEIAISHFISGKRCPYCHGFKVHPLDSLGELLRNKGLLGIWSDKNEKTSYEYTPMSNQIVWWKCPDGKHEDYKRRINESNDANFRCPNCQYSKGEKRIEEYLSINSVKYISQKEFDGLLGLGGGNLSYDFYIGEPYNFLIEYQGEQHEKYIRGFHKSKKDFEKQVEHDKRKREYANNHNIKLLEIWYWNFDNIEEILNKELKINNNKNIQKAV